MKKENLEKLFEQHRIVFIYDEGMQLWDEIALLEIPGVTKLEIKNNEFSLKVRVLNQEPEAKFLLYKLGERPNEEDDWLYELRLANTEYKCDRVSDLLIELGLGEAFREVLTSETSPVVKALEFFKTKARTDKLRAAIEPGVETCESLTVKMLALSCGQKSDASLEDVLRVLIFEESEARTHSTDRKRWKAVCEYGLEPLLRSLLKSVYGYETVQVNVWDFVLVLFGEIYRRSVDNGARKILTNQAKHLFDCVRTGSSQENYEMLSTQICRALSLSFDETCVRTHLACDVYKEIDACMADFLIKRVTDGTASVDEVRRIVEQRSGLYWSDVFKNDYQAALSASEFLSLLHQMNFACAGFGDAVHCYTQSWYKLDRLYRAFTCASEAGSREGLDELKKQIHAKYVTNCLLPMSQAVQGTITSAKDFDVSGVARQHDFYAQFTGGAAKGEKCYVFISDALRYEIGTELAERLLRNNRYDVELKPMIARVPTYTQLGMAALLPHKTLCLGEDSRVLADGMSTTGTEAREGVLKSFEPTGAVAIQLEDLKKMDRVAVREMQKQNRVIYVYQNVIDKTGDDVISEGRVFESVKDAIEDLLAVFKRVGGYNNTKHFYFTSDHGFLYQHNPVEESDFISLPSEKDGITYQGRRFVLGKNLQDHASLMRFKANELGLDGETDVQIAKGMLRMKVSGSGSRYTHGGATLQEVIVPVVSVHRKDSDDVKRVDVSVMKHGMNQIKTSQFSVKLYQTDAVGGKILPREIRVSLRGADGTLLSDSHELMFDSASNQVSDREKTVSLTLTAAAEKMKNCDVYLTLEERIEDTNQYRPYDKVVYQLVCSNMIPMDF